MKKDVDSNFVSNFINLLIYSRYYALELCAASVEKFYLKDGDANKYRGTMPAVEDILIQLGEGLEHIHKKKLVHRDLKPENALIWVGPGDDGKEKVILKWADFGLCKPTNTRGTFEISAIKGTLNWLAPEILELYYSVNKMFPRGTVQSDVFAEGLVFSYILLEGEHPYGVHEGDVIDNLRRNNAVNLTSTLYIKFLLV